MIVSRIAKIGGFASRVRTFDSMAESVPYRWLWLGNFFGQSAQWLQLLTVGWLIRSLTVGSVLSPMFVVTASALTFLPFLLTGPFMATLGDSFERRKLVMVVQSFMALMALSIGLLAGAHLVSIWHVYGYAFIGGICLSITMPTRLALIPDTVPESLLGNAITLNMLTISATRVVGPLIGGILIFTLGFFWNFAFESFLYIGNVLVFWFLTTPYFTVVTKDQSHNVLADLIEGFQYIWYKNRVLLYLALVALIPNTLLEPALFMLPVFTSEVLRQGADVGGYLMAIDGFGGVVMGITLSSVGFIFPRGKVMLISVIVSAAAVLVFSHSYILPLAIAVILIRASALAVNRAATIVLLQSLSTPEMRVRVVSLITYSASLSIIVSVFLGWLAGYTSIPISLAILGFVGLLLGVFCYSIQKKIKLLD